MLEGVLKHCKDILFPVFCVECGGEGEWWCEKCLGKKKVQPMHWCPGCANEVAAGKRCEACKAVAYLDGVTALFNYEEGTPVAKLIHHFKYRYVREIGEIWRNLLTSIPSLGAIIPIPLHPRRERERGFNQAKLLAEILSDELKIAGHSAAIDDDNLVRKRFTRQQARLSKEERLENVTDAFIWRGQSPAPRLALLVDDVYTTGATMQECARVLKQHGTERVWGFVLGRG